MTRLSLAALAILLSIGGVRAETLWVGNAFVVDTIGPCGKSAAVGDFWRATYRPRGAGLGNGANSYLALMGSRSSFVLTVPNNDFRVNINYGAQTIGSTLSISSHQGGIVLWEEAFAAGTTYIDITSRFTKFFGVSNCSAKLLISLVRL